MVTDEAYKKYCVKCNNGKVGCYYGDKCPIPNWHLKYETLIKKIKKFIKES